jgi:hypothetical protein
MFSSKFGRLAAITTATAALTLCAVPLAGAASAAPAKTGIKCGTLTGNIASTVTLSKCKGNTGKSSKPIPATELASGGTITWANGQTTTVTLSVKQAGTACPAGSTEYQATGKVTKDTTGSAAVGSKAKALACASATGAISLVPGTKATI